MNAVDLFCGDGGVTTGIKTAADRAGIKLDEVMTKHVCDESCKYWRFTHLDTACVLSPVFSVPKGEMCAEYTPNKDGASMEGMVA